MSTATTRLALTKPASSETVDVTILNGDFDKIDNAVGATVCTSTTRPSAPFTGQLAYTTDGTPHLIIWNGTAWVTIV